MKRKIVLALQAFVFSFIWYTAASSIAIFNFPMGIKWVVGMFGYIFLTSLIISKYSVTLRPRYILLFIILGVLIPMYPSVFLYFRASLNGLITDILWLVGCFIGYGIYNANRRDRIILISISSLIGLTLMLKGESIWNALSELWKFN